MLLRMLWKTTLLPSGDHMAELSSFWSVYVAEETVVVKSSGQRNGPSGFVDR